MAAVDWPAIRRYRSYDELLTDPAVQVVDLATRPPGRLHLIGRAIDVDDDHFETSIKLHFESEKKRGCAARNDIAMDSTANTFRVSRETMYDVAVAGDMNRWSNPVRGSNIVSALTQHPTPRWFHVKH